MRILNYGGIPTSLGEIINLKYHFDLIKHQYDQIILSFHKQLWRECLHTEALDWNEKEILWNKYLNDIGELFFSEPPYILVDSSAKYGGDTGAMVIKFNITPHKSEMGHLLCSGISLNIDEEYIVITTKVRQSNKNIIQPLLKQLWNILNILSKKYMIVVLGERTVEMRKEYGKDTNSVFCLYDDIIGYLPKNRLIDLTVPALGETVSDFSKIQQDCFLMKEAKFVITIGVGGNFCMSTSTANMAIGFRTDNLDFTNAVFNREYSNAIITKDWRRFMQAISAYL